MWDASSKIPVGQMVSKSINIGHFDECLDIENAPFETQYCLIDIKLNLEKSSNNTERTVFDSILAPHDEFRNWRNLYSNGICLPKSCDYNTLKTYLNIYFDNYSLNNEFNITYEVSFPPNACQSTKQTEYDEYDIAFCVLILGFATLVIVSSILRSYLNLKPGSTAEIIIRSFSLSHTIYDDLLKIDDSNLKYLHGIKVFALTWVIFGHCAGFTHAGVVYDYSYSENVYSYLYNYLFMRGDLWVDTFFILSGLLLSYTLLKQYSKTKKLNLILIIILRYFRLTPLYAISIFFFATLLSKMGDGPMWHVIVDGEKQFCRENWWTNLLYINNYVNNDKTCMVHTWYLPCDMHFFIIGLFIVQVMQTKYSSGRILLIFGTLISMIIPALITYLNNLAPVIKFSIDFVQHPRDNEIFTKRYILSHSRMTPFLIGIFAGYILFSRKDIPIKFSKRVSILLSSLSSCTLVALLITTRILYVPYFSHPMISALYVGLNRLVWSCATVVFIFCLQYGQLNTVKNMLSCKILAVLGKLTYAVYLLHPIYLIYVMGNQKVPYTQGDIALLNIGLQTMTIAYILAFFAYITIEAPLRNILKAIFLKPSKEDRTNNTLNIVTAI
ncbi:nose resistant to fluoxetine protein 6-like, partial [Chrysoperla carnea]|uniref:nose resistant to fluoxetine protein 6-like n=1 Tax=Chrysoperla carnea TaxID=189513 RepID=UPI001D093894